MEVLESKIANESAEKLVNVYIWSAMKAMIIEDEARARSLLKSILLNNCRQEIAEVFEAADLKTGVQKIKEHQPEIVFLDIEMPHERGTEILNYFDNDEISFEIVFTTAYSDFALKAFEMNAVDYILKPIRPTKVKSVVQKVKQNQDTLAIRERLSELKNSLSKTAIQKIGLPIADGILFVAIDEIVHIKAEGMYTKLFCIKDGELLISKPLKFYEQLLDPPTTFFKPHRSHMLNMRYLKQYVNRDGHYALLENGEAVPIAKDRREELLRLLSEQ